MNTPNVLTSLFNYKAWANAALFAELQKVDATEHAEQREAAIRLLNHIYVVDGIFAAHLAGREHACTATNTVETPSLEELHFAVAERDAWYVQYASAVSPASLAEQVSFKFTDGLHGTMTREEMLVHVSTHGAYHRGAVGRIMAQIGTPPPRDLFTIYLHTTEPARREAA